MKIDIQLKSIARVWEDPKCIATEPLMIPDPSSTVEDMMNYKEEDGVLIFVCHGVDEASHETSLVVLNTELEELGRFRAPVPTTIGIHGIWIPN